MAIPPDCARISLIGHQTTGELFDTSFWIAGTNVPTSNADANALAETVSAGLGGDTLTSIAALLNPDSGYDQVRVYSYPTGGPSASYIGAATIGSGVGTATATAALQQAMCITLRTAQAGRSHRGRMYLPADGVALTTGHLFSFGLTTDVVDKMASFFSYINTLSASNNVQVVSQTLTTATEVTTVTADQRPDIQRRRANRQTGGTIASADVDPG